jgi:hypothetical protein
MAHVFISYSSKHRALTEKLAGYLQNNGLKVWWDDALEARGPFDSQIHAALQAAGSVVVIWTTGAIVSDWVKREAKEAYEQNKLINVLPEDIKQEDIPKPFRDHHRHRPLDHRKILSDVLAAHEGRPLPKVVPLLEIYEEGFEELLLDNKRVVLPEDVSAAPSLLLQAKHGLVEFSDLHGLKRSFVDWAEGRGDNARKRSVAGRLIHGPGGLGKTRLMIEVAASLRDAGWSAGFLNSYGPSVHETLCPLHPDAPPDWVKNDNKRRLRSLALAQLVEGADDKGLAVVLDYAEGRTEEVCALAKQMIDAGKVDATRPRVLILLAREIGDWWDNVRQEQPLLNAMFSTELGRIDEIAMLEEVPRAARGALFEAARKAFAKALAHKIEVNPDPPSEAQAARIARATDYDRPLAILMEALLHTYAKALSGDESGLAPLLAQILDLEIAHWKKVLPDIGDTRELQRGTAQITLVGGTSTRAEASTLLMEDPYYAGVRLTPAATEPIARALARFYGNGRGGLNGLEPDLVGEHLVLTQADWDLSLAKQLVAACTSWEGGGKERYTAILTVLNRATKPEHGPKAKLSENLLTALVSRYATDLAPYLVKVALSEPEGRLPEAVMVALPELDEEALRVLDSALPGQTTRLMEAALAVAERRSALARELCAVAHAAAIPSAHRASLHHLAARLSNLAVRLSNVGRRKDGLAASKEAVEIYRRLAKDQPEDFLPDLGRSLSNAGAMFSNLDQREEALVASEEAVAIYRKLAREGTHASLSDFASSLANLGKDLFSLDRGEEALSALTEALVIYRTLAEDQPAIFLSDLAKCLNNSGVMLTYLCRHQEALYASEEAVAIYRRLAKERPDAFLPDLANSLGALSEALATAERSTEAADAAREGLAAIVPFVLRQPEAFGDLACKLWCDHVAACGKAALEPDAVLITRLASTLGSGEVSEGNTPLAGLLGRVLAMIEAVECLDKSAATASLTEIFNSPVAREIDRIMDEKLLNDIFEQQKDEMFEGWEREMAELQSEREALEKLGSEMCEEYQIEPQENELDEAMRVHDE